MQLSVVVPTLNGREELARCLDALAERVPAAEVVVVNGPSADGTTGMVRDRADVDVLVEVADRRINAARNAGIDHASGDVVAIVDRSVTVEAGWLEALEAGIADAAVVTGPTHQELAAGMTTESLETATVAGREVTFFNPGNVAFRRSVLDELDGFDEYLEVGGGRDMSHRLAAAGHDVAWSDGMAVRSEVGADGGARERDWGVTYRSVSYRLVKNYGLRPGVAAVITRRSVRDGYERFRDVLSGDVDASLWLGTGREVALSVCGGIRDGLAARLRDDPPRRNPNGRSARTDRAVAVYDSRAQ